MLGTLRGNRVRAFLSNVARLWESCAYSNDDDDTDKSNSSSSKLRTSGYCLSQELFESLDTLYSMLESPLPEMIAKEWSTMQHMALQLARLALTHAIEHADVVHSLEVLIHRHLALLSQRYARASAGVAIHLGLTYSPML